QHELQTVRDLEDTVFDGNARHSITLREPRKPMNIWGVSAGGNQQALPRAANAGAMLDPPRSGRLYDLSPAGWQSGYAEDCKSSYSGSIPLPASRETENKINGLETAALLSTMVRR